MTEQPRTYGHVAVRFNHNILVTCGTGLHAAKISPRLIWMYNIYTEQWRKKRIPDQQMAPPPTMDACAVTIAGDMYMFGGCEDNNIFHRFTNNLWKLTMTTERCFSWTKIESQSCTKLPSPRTQHAGWEHEGCLWVFGGLGDNPSTLYLNDHGDYVNLNNNQLLCYDPSNKTWTNPQSFGAVPSPRASHSTAIIKDKLWLLGGDDQSYTYLNDIFSLDMCSRAWTQIETALTKPAGHRHSTLTAISENQLALHGGLENQEVRDTWVYDLPSGTWRQHTLDKNVLRNSHTGSLGANKSIIIIGGCSNGNVPPVVHVMFEPRSLQQLAMKTIYNHQSQLPWTCLPPKLIDQLELSENQNLIKT